MAASKSVSAMTKNRDAEEVTRTTPKLPKGWQSAELAGVADIIMGQSPSSEYYNADGKGLPFFQGKAEFGNNYPEAVKWCTKPNKVAQKEDVLISVRAPVGPTNLAPSECCIGRGLAAIRPRNGIPSKYILYYLRSVESKIEALGTGTTFKAISGKMLRTIQVPVAPPDQQKLIVAEIEKQFSRLDEAVANLKRAKANLKRYKSAVLKAAVEGSLVKTEAEVARGEGRTYETGEQLLQRILESRRKQWKGKGNYRDAAAPDTTNLHELPAGWVWASLDQLTNQVADVDHKMPKAHKDGIPYVSTRDFTGDHEIKFEGAKRISLSDYDALCKKVRPARDDILLSRYGTVGEVRIIKTDIPFQASYSIAILKPVTGYGIAAFIDRVRLGLLDIRIKPGRAPLQPHVRGFFMRYLASN